VKIEKINQVLNVKFKHLIFLILSQQGFRIWSFKTQFMLHYY